MAARGRASADSVLTMAVARGLTVQAAARKAGVAPRTVYRRLRDPAFQQAVAEARSAILRRTVGRLAAAGTAASRTLRKLLESSSPTAQLGAARAIMEYSFRGAELLDVAERVEALEARSGEVRR